jgi:hypothetical protein
MDACQPTYTPEDQRLIETWKVLDPGLPSNTLIRRAAAHGSATERLG